MRRRLATTGHAETGEQPRYAAVHCRRTVWCGCAHHAVELLDCDPPVEDGCHARIREHRCVQTCCVRPNTARKFVICLDDAGLLNGVVNYVTGPSSEVGDEVMRHGDGDIEALDDLVSVTPTEFINERDIDPRLEHEVTTIDLEARTVSVVGPDGEQFEQAYDSLLIATGAHASRPDMLGTDIDGVFTLHSITAGRDIREYVTRARNEHTPRFHDGSNTAAQQYLDAQPPETVALVSGGYIGIELGLTGAVATDEYGRTSVSNVFAAGDCAEVDSVVSEEPIYAPFALTANRYGRAIGQTVAGNPTPVGPATGTAAVKAFDLEAATTGIVDHDDAEELGFDPITNTIEVGSRGLLSLAARRSRSALPPIVSLVSCWEPAWSERKVSPIALIQS